MAATTPKKKTKKTAADVLKAAEPMERTVKVCVAGDLVADYDAAVAEMERAQQASDSITGRLSARTDGHETVAALARKVRDLETAMSERTFTFRFRAVSGKRWSDLLAEHASKDKNKLFNADTFVPAVIADCCIDPEGFDDVEVVAELFDKLTAGQQSDLFEAVWEVNQAAPKEVTSSAASAILRRCETTSTTAPTVESPAASSSG